MKRKNQIVEELGKEQADMEINNEISKDEEVVIDLYDRHTLVTGEYVGRVSRYSQFKAKNGNTFGKIVLGTKMKYGTDEQVVEAERVYVADYHTDSELVQLLTVLGCVEGYKLYPERILNKAVKFILKDNPDATNSRYKYVVSEIVPIDSLPDNLDFRYEKVWDINGFTYVPKFKGKESDNHSDTRPSMKQLFEDGEDAKVNFD